MSLEIAIHLLVDTLNCALGLYVLRRDPKDIVHRSFCVFALGIAGWSAGILLVSLTGEFFFVTFALWSGELVVLGFILFAKTFPGHDAGISLRNKWFLTSLIPLGLLFLVSPFRLILQAAQFNARGYLVPKNGPLFPVFAVMLAAYIVWGVWHLIKKYLRSEGVAHVQLRYVIAGAGAFLAGAFVFDVLLPAFNIFSFNLLGPLCSVVFVGCAAYAIVRHELMDIQVIVKKGITYALVVLATVAIFMSLEFIIEKFIDPNDEVVDIFAAAVGALLFAQLKDFFANATDKVFFRGQYDYTMSIRELGTLVNSTIDLRALLASFTDFLMKTVKPSEIMFFLKSGQDIVPFGLSHDTKEPQRANEYKIFAEKLMADRREPLFFEKGDREGFGIGEAKTLDIAAAIPFVSNDGVNGILMLGKKLSDDIYRSKDIELLRVVAYQAGIAVENARLYDELKRSNEELELRVRERTEKVRTMQEAQSKFLTDVSHELQNPLAIMKGNIEVVERKRKGDRKTALIATRNALDRMAQMVDHLLAIARLNFSKQKLYKEGFSVDNLLEEIYHDCVALTEDKGVTLSYAMSASIALFADREKIKAVILNLTSNALKHTGSGGTISLSAERSRERILIFVRDTGSGIAPERLPLIFERFYRIEGDGTTGTGLGLDIVKKIIEAHGGVISAESVLGKGSCFAISLPADLP
jgi:signal transduction histidine kinase